MAQHAGLLRRQRAARQGVEEQAHGVQRLAQVVARRGEEARLVLVGLLGRRQGLHGALGLGAQLRHQALVVEAQLDAVARRARQVARVQRREQVVHGHHHAAGQGDGPAHHGQGDEHAADGAGQVDHVAAQQRRAQAQRAGRDGAEDADGVDHGVAALALPQRHAAERAPGQAHARHAGQQPPRVAARAVARARQRAQRQVHQRNHRHMRGQPPQHGRHGHAQ